MRVAGDSASFSLLVVFSEAIDIHAKRVGFHWMCDHLQHADHVVTFSIERNLSKENHMIIGSLRPAM